MRIKRSIILIIARKSVNSRGSALTRLEQVVESKYSAASHAVEYDLHEEPYEERQHQRNRSFLSVKRAWGE